jgi:ferric-chelate reductase
MDMGDSMPMGDGSSDMPPLNASGVDFSNSTQAAAFLGEILDDTVLQVDGNLHARYFWYGVCAVIVIGAFCNLSQKGTSILRYAIMRVYLSYATLIDIGRMRAAAANRPRPASPSTVFAKSIATITAICRETSYAQVTPKASRFLKVPPIGTIILLVGYLAWVILLEFMNNNIAGAQHYTSLAIRAAWLALAQVPLLILLAGKNNLIGFVSGISYERLNVIHRWVARVLLFLVTLHVIFLHLAWNAYGLKDLEYATDSCIPTGYAVYVILLWMNLSTLAPIRNFSYEFFVVQHVMTFFGFLVAIMFHLPSTALYSRVYIYIPIALFLVGRGIRAARFAWNNARPGRATIIALNGGVTRITVRTKAIHKWSPGAHVFLSIPKLGPGQSHPATIASIPSSHSGNLVFILKGHKGFTSRLLKSATNSTRSLLSTEEASAPRQTSEPSTYVALIDGPYGGSHSDFCSFDTVFVISGSTGITFTLPILLDIAARAQNARLPVRRVTFLWIVKNTSWTSWTASELTSASQTLKAAGIDLSIKIHVTCDTKFTTGEEDQSEDSACECDKNAGPCCCVNVDSPDDIREVDGKEEHPSEKKDVQINEQPQSQCASLKSGTGSSILPCATFQSGRPDIYSMLWELLEEAEGETGVAVCGPLGLNSDVRTKVVRCSDERAVHKGTGAEGIYLHSECFAW